MKANDPNKDKLSIELSDEIQKDLEIHTNVTQKIIITTEDKIKIVLTEAKEALRARRDWATPLGIFITLIATLITADFKDKFSLKAEYFISAFFIFAVISGVWLLRAFIKLIKYRKQDNPEYIIEKLKLQNELTTVDERIVVSSNEILISLPINRGFWKTNHWAGGNYAKIIGDKMIFSGNDGIDENGSHIDIENVLEIGKTYRISCFTKSKKGTTARFQLWCHDEVYGGNEKSGIRYPIPPIIPSMNGEKISMDFIAQNNKNIRIHLQYFKGEGEIEVSDVKIIELDLL